MKKWERNWWIVRKPNWSLSFDFGISTEPYWINVETKSKADQFRSFPLGLSWDRMVFYEWGIAEGPALKLVFMKARLWFVRNT